MLGELTSGDQYGLGFAGVSAQLVKLFLARFWSQGGSLLTADWQPQINSENGVAALHMLFDEMQQYTPPGILAWDNPTPPMPFSTATLPCWKGGPASSCPASTILTIRKIVDKWSVAKYPGKRHGELHPA